MIEITGDFFDGSASVRRSAAITVNDAEQVTIYALENGERERIYRCDLSEIEISPRLGKTPRYLNFENGANFETNDHDNVDRLLEQTRRNPVPQLIHKLESRLAIVLVFAVFVIGFMWAGVKYGIPAVADTIAQELPAEYSQYIGQEAIEILDQVAFEPTELPTARQKELNRLFQTYTDDYPDYAITVQFRKAEGIGANAFALPNGTIVFTDDMVDLAENDNELVAILGHEIGHVVHRHVLRRIIQDSTLTMLMLLVTGDVSSASSIVLALPTIMLDMSYSRKFEIEADDFAFDFLTTHQLKPDHFANIMQRLEQYHLEKLDDKHAEAETHSHSNKKSSDEVQEEEDGFFTKVTPYLSTHPQTEDRIRRFQTQSDSQE